MSDELCPLNPFSVPEAGGPKMPLRPWLIESHKDYYVAVGNTDDAFKEFTRRTNDLVTLQREGQLVLAAGESGCGKTTLINKCAWHVREKLRAAEITGVVVPLQQSLMAKQDAAGDERFSLVLHELLAVLESEGALRPDTSKIMQDYGAHPGAIYRQMHNLLKPQHAAIVLLPASDLLDDVVRYGALSCRNVLFMAELVYGSSSNLEAAVDEIEDRLAKYAPPVTLRLAGLKQGDSQLYISDRLERNRGEGKYPFMATETMDALGPMLQSVAHMQSTCHGFYEERMRNGLKYDPSSFVDLEEIRSFIIMKLSSRRGKT